MGKKKSKMTACEKNNIEIIMIIEPWDNRDYDELKESWFFFASNFLRAF